MVLVVEVLARLTEVILFLMLQLLARLRGVLLLQAVAQVVVVTLMQVLLVVLVVAAEVALAHPVLARLVVRVHQDKVMLAGLVRIAVLLMVALVAVAAQEL